MELLWRRQALQWPMMRAGLDGLQRSLARSFDIGGSRVFVQCNPARAASAGARIDAASLAARPCFLCRKNRPNEQEAVTYGNGWVILCNPMPIFDPHFTVVIEEHVPQRVLSALPTMMALTRDTGGRFTVFYNGPRCGASAPDHLHIQAVPSGATPFETELGVFSGAEGDAFGRDWVEWLTGGPARLGVSRVGRRPTVFLTGRDEASVRDGLVRAIKVLGDIQPAEPEPMLNLFVAYAEPDWLIWYHPRQAHRPSCFGHGPQQYLISPGAADLAGVLIVPRRDDFERITAEDIASVFNEVLLTPSAFAQLRDRLRG